MAQVLIRELDQETVTRLKAQSELHGRSFEGELRFILNEAAAKGYGEVDMLAESRKIKALFKGKRFADSSSLLREDRER